MALGYEYNCTKAHNEAFSLRDPEVFGTNVSDLNPGTPGHMVNRLGIGAGSGLWFCLRLRDTLSFEHADNLNYTEPLHLTWTSGQKLRMILQSGILMHILLLVRDPPSIVGI